MKLRKKKNLEVVQHKHQVKTGSGIQTFGHPHPIDAVHSNKKTQAHHDFTVQLAREEEERKKKNAAKKPMRLVAA
ncbi:hypothetical protein KAR91_00605 [Candidatus Pacearchaeota archaeon]|nr:hypothetical protein [Candidatus Pacearchaeota archaeon]